VQAALPLVRAADNDSDRRSPDPTVPIEKAL